MGNSKKLPLIVYVHVTPPLRTDSIEEIRKNVRNISQDSAVTREKLNHLASDNDVSQAISLCQSTQHKIKPTNWKGITALITGIIVAATGGAVAIITAFNL